MQVMVLMSNFLVEALRVHIIAPRIERLSMRDCVRPVVDDFFLNKHLSVSVDLSADFRAYVSGSHFRYILLQVLRFCTHSELVKQQEIRIWLSEGGKVYVRLMGSAIPASLLDEIIQLFPSEASNYVADVALGLAELLLLATEGMLRYGSGVEHGVAYTEFKASETICNVILGYDSTKTAIIATGIVIIYSAFGGIRAVTLTNIFQFIT